MNYEITAVFSENKGKHVIKETYIVSDDKSLKKTIGNLLDMYIDRKTGIPQEPDVDKITESLKMYTDYYKNPKATNNTIKQMKRMWKIYNKIVDKIIDGEYNWVEEKIDKNSKIIVDKFG